MEENKTTSQEDTIFTANDFSLQKYEKHVRNARTTLYVVSGLIVLAGIFSSFVITGENLLDIWIEVIVMAGTFLVLGIWSNSKPFTALLIGLIVYVLYHLLYMFIDPSNIGRGIIIKIIVVVYLVRGMNNAREAQEWKNAIKKD